MMCLMLRNMSWTLITSSKKVNTFLEKEDLL